MKTIFQRLICSLIKFRCCLVPVKYLLSYTYNYWILYVRLKYKIAIAWYQANLTFFLHTMSHKRVSRRTMSALHLKPFNFRYRHGGMDAKSPKKVLIIISIISQMTNCDRFTKVFLFNSLYKTWPTNLSA